MNTLEPCRVEASSSSTPANRSSASSTTTIILPAAAPSSLAIISAATRSWRSGSAPLVLFADEMHAAPESRAKRLGELAFSRPRRPVKQDVGAADAVASGDDAHRQLARFSDMGEILPGERCRLRITQEEAADLFAAKPSRRQKFFDDISKAKIATVINTKKTELRSQAAVPDLPRMRQLRQETPQLTKIVRPIDRRVFKLFVSGRDQISAHAVV